MKNKTLLKFLLCFFIIGTFFTSSVFAAGPSAESFFNAANQTDVKDAINELNNNMQPVYHIQSIIMLVGSVAAAIVTMIYAIQWMTATPAKRQELKASLFPLIGGIALLSIGPRVAIWIVEAIL